MFYNSSGCGGGTRGTDTIYEFISRKFKVFILTSLKLS